MRPARLTWIAAVLASLGALSCLPAANDSGSAFDGGSGDGCSNDSQCGSAGGCVAGRCVPRAMDTSKWAIEIDPPRLSGSQITELPSFVSAMPMIIASAGFELTIPFLGRENVGAALPASASAIVTVPSRIPGRPDLSFQSMLELGVASPEMRTTSALARVNLPDALRGQMATVSLIPLPPSDRTTPPYTFAIPIPLAGQPFSTLELPTNSRALRGQALDALGDAKVQFTARAFRNGVLVSTTARTEATGTNPAGNFVIILPSGTGDGITLELAPDPGTSDPWVTYPGLSLTQQNTDLGAIKLAPVLKATPFQVTIHGEDTGATPVSGAKVRGYTTLEGGDARASARFIRDGVSDGGGTATLSLMPGDTDSPRPYTLSIVPPAGSMWATQCLDNVPAQWPGAASVTLLRAVTLPRRAVITGSLLSASGVPVANAIITATGGEAPMPHCLAGPTTTSTTTDATGSFTLRLDPGKYQVEYDPPAGSALPRMIDRTVDITPADTYRTVVVRLPTPVLVEGDVFKAPAPEPPGRGVPVRDATVRIFESLCPPPDPCTVLLRAETQTDANGHFRAVVAMPGTN